MSTTPFIDALKRLGIPLAPETQGLIDRARAARAASAERRKAARVEWRKKHALAKAARLPKPARKRAPVPLSRAAWVELKRETDSVWGDTLVVSVLVRRGRWSQEDPTSTALVRVRSRGLTPLRILCTREGTDGTEVVVRAFEPLRG
jgi:hypothetical protein